LIGAAERKLEAAQARLRTLEANEVVARLRTQVEDYAALLTESRARNERAETAATEWKSLALENGDLYLRQERRLAELESEQTALEATLRSLLEPRCTGCASEEPQCPGVNLCGRYVFYVGGRDRQCAHFRALVEQQNGRFLHHDGGLADGRQRLAPIITRADVVFCSVDCISHDARSPLTYGLALPPLTLAPRPSLSPLYSIMRRMGTCSLPQAWRLWYSIASHLTMLLLPLARITHRIQDIRWIADGAQAQPHSTQ